MLERREEGKDCKGSTYKMGERRTSDDGCQGKTGGGECRKGKMILTGVEE